MIAHSGELLPVLSLAGQKSSDGFTIEDYQPTACVGPSDSSAT
jgi:hypothetical protein